MIQESCREHLQALEHLTPECNRTLRPFSTPLPPGLGP